MDINHYPTRALRIDPRSCQANLQPTVSDDGIPPTRGPSVPMMINHKLSGS